MTTSPQRRQGATPIPLSYEVRESQEKMAGLVAKWWSELVRFNPGTIDRSQWLVDNQVFAVHGYQGRAFQLHVIFDHQGFDPAYSGWEYGKTRILDDTLAPVAGHSFLFDNRNHDEPLDIDQTESVTYSQTRSTSTSHETSIDIGIGSKTTGSIGGDAVGAKLEQEFSASLGIGSKDETTKAEEESTDRTASVDVQTSVDPDTATLGVIKSPDVTSLTPFAVNGVWVSPLTISFVNIAFNSSSAAKDLTRSKRAKESAYDGPTYFLPTTVWTVKFTSWDDFIETITGVNTDFPAINRQLGGDGIVNALNDPENRRLQWSGTQHRKYQKASDYSYVDQAPGADLDSIIEQYGIDADHVIQGGQ